MDGAGRAGWRAWTAAERVRSAAIVVCLIGAVLAAVTGHLVLELMLLGLAAVTFVINAVLGGTDRRA